MRGTRQLVLEQDEKQGDKSTHISRCFAVFKMGVDMLKLNCSAGFR